jgi:ATP-dependent Clp protease adaptor protein ClpS
MDYESDAQSPDSDVCEEIESPREYQVIMYNDDYTTMDFVVQILLEVFNKPHSESIGLMKKIHMTGEAVIGIYSYDIAATLVTMTVKTARAYGFPLRCKMEMI